MSTRRGFPEPLPAGEKTWRSSKFLESTTPTGKITHYSQVFRTEEKTVEATFHACVYKKKPPELLQVRRLQSKRRLPTLPL